MKPDKKHTKQMIKTTALVLAAAIMMSIAVTACSDKRENPETPENPTTGATDITAAPTDENDAASTTEAPWCHSEIITGTEPDNIEIITPTSILEAQSQEESSKGTKPTTSRTTTTRRTESKTTTTTSKKVTTTTTTNPGPTECQHNWEPVYETIEHPAETEEVVVSEGYYERRIAHKSIHCSNGGQHEEFFDIIFDKDDNVLYSGFEEALERWGLWHQKNECVCRRSNGVIDYGEEYEGWVPPRHRNTCRSRSLDRRKTCLRHVHPMRCA